MKPIYIRLIVILMSAALLGLAILQTFYILQVIKLNEEKFDRNVRLALDAVVERLKDDELTAAADSLNFNHTPRKSISSLEAEEINISLQEMGLDTQYSHAEVEVTADLEKFNSDIFGGEPEVTLDFNAAQAAITGWLVIRSEIPIEDRVNLTKLGEHLKTELQEHGIEMPFKYGIYSSHKKKFFYVFNYKSDIYSTVYNFRSPKLNKDPNIFKDLSNSNYKIRMFPTALDDKGILSIHFPERNKFVMGSVWLQLAGTISLLLIILFCFGYTVNVALRQKKLSDMKNDFINNMTHEFKTPIATIGLASDTINNPAIAENPEKVRRFANIIKQENHRMNGQVEKVLQMAQIDKNEFQLRIEQTDLHTLISNAADNISIQIESKEGSLSLELNAEKTDIEADETHISNIIHNLLDNANKYSPEKPEIILSTQNISGGVLLIVKDNGIGISKEARKYIFDKFYRVPTGNVHDVKGFGLGLSYVKAMVTAHGGHIDVKSELGKGSQFEVFLPFKNLSVKIKNN